MFSQFPFHFVTGWLGAKSFLPKFTKSLPVKSKVFTQEKIKKNAVDLSAVYKDLEEH